jgi:putative ABC transport system substrate-binding protein
VVGLLALSLNLAKGPAGSVGGVGILPAPERYLELFKAIGARRVGIVHDPARTGHYLKRARAAAQQSGIALVVREVRSPQETAARLEQMQGAVDALWMLPDSTAVTAETLEAFSRFSLRHKVPVVTFSEQYLAKGAAVSLDIDRTDLGRQAGEQANALLAHPGARSTTLDARKLQLHANGAVARNLGLEIPASLR